MLYAYYTKVLSQYISNYNGKYSQKHIFEIFAFHTFQTPAFSTPAFSAAPLMLLMRLLIKAESACCHSLTAVVPTGND